MKKTITVLLCVLMSFSLISCGKNNEEKKVPELDNPPVQQPEEDPIEEMPFMEQLQQGVETGASSKDDYVACTVLSVFDETYIPEQYKNKDIEITDVRPYLEQAELYFDDLSDETKTELANCLFLGNLEFAEPQKQTGFVEKTVDGLFEQVNAKTSKVIIDNVLLSNSGNFLVWYSDYDKNSVAKAFAQQVADELDEAVAQLDAYFDTTYRYENVNLFSDMTASRQMLTLAGAGISADKLTACMNVYLCDFSDSDVYAQYCGGFEDLMEKLVVYFHPAFTGVKTFPYIIIDSDQPFDTLMKQVIYHELFHHYQNYVLKLGTEPLCNKIGLESTANWAAAETVTITDNTIDFSLWSSQWQQNCDDWLNKNDETRAGYGLYTMLHFYEEQVSDGRNKIVEALYNPDFLAYLQNASTESERNAMMGNLAFHGFANDYTNPALKAKTAYTSTNALTTQSSVKGATANKISIHYYQVNPSSGDGQGIKFNANTAEICATLFVKNIDGSFSCVDTVNGSSSVITLPQNDNIKTYYIAVSNGSFTQSGTYDLEIVETKDPANTINLDRCVIFNENHLKITAESAEIKKNDIYLNCSYEYDSTDQFTLRVKGGSLNGYKASSYIEGVYYKELNLEPNGKGTFTVILHSMFYLEHIDFRTMLNCDAIGEIGIQFIYSKAGAEETWKWVTVKTADYGKENMTECIIESYATTYLNLGYKEFLGYQKTDITKNGITIMGVAAFKQEDDSHVLLIEVNNTTDKEENESVTVWKVNGLKAPMFHYVNAPAHCKSIAIFETDEFSLPDQMASYGISNIGSYLLSFFETDYVEEHAVDFQFGSVSPVTTLQEVVDADGFTLYYVGSSVRMIEGYVYESDTSVHFYLKCKGDDIGYYSLERKVVVDGVADYASWSNFIRDEDGFVELELDDVDPNIAHTVTFSISYYSGGWRKTSDITIQI